MERFKARTKLDKFFEVGILLKAVDGVLETIAGILLLIINPITITHLVTILTQHEIATDPHNIVANYLLHASLKLTKSATLFAAIYLLSHGLSKIILVVEILRNHLWAYVGLIVLTSSFIIYQTYRWVYTHSISLLLLTIFDGAVVYLTIKEYEKRLLERSAT